MPRLASALEGERLFVEHLDLIERVVAFVCARHHVAAADGEDFGSYVKLKMIESDYAALTRFEARSSLRTYLVTVIQRLFLDYRIAAWGKWRPSAAARRAGELGVLLERLLTRDGLSFEEACEQLRSNHRVNASRAELERIAAQLPMRAPRRFASDEQLATMPSADRPTDLAVTEREQADRVSDLLKRVMGALDVQDRLILALRFEDGRTVADIAVALQIDQKALYRRVDRLLRELRRQLQDAGIDTSILQALDNPDVSIEWQGGGNA